MPSHSFSSCLGAACLLAFFSVTVSAVETEAEALARIARQIAGQTVAGQPVAAVDGVWVDGLAAEDWQELGAWRLEGQGAGPYPQDVAAITDGAAPAIAFTWRKTNGHASVYTPAIDCRPLRHPAKIKLRLRNLGQYPKTFIWLADESGNHWQAVTGLTPDWKEYVFTPDQFGFFQGPTPGKLADFSRVSAVRIGLDPRLNNSLFPASIGIGSIQFYGKPEPFDAAAVFAALKVKATPQQWAAGRHAAVIYEDGLYRKAADSLRVLSSIKILVGLGFRVEILGASAAADPRALNFSAVDVLVLPAAVFPEAAAENILAYVRSGGSVVCLGGQAPLSRPLTKSASGRWREKPAQGCPMGASVAGAELARALLHEIDASSLTSAMTLTPAGRQLFGALPLPAAPTLLVRSLTNSALGRIAPLECEITDLVACVYKAKNWIQQEDVFDAAPVFVAESRDWDYSGAKVAFCGLPDIKGTATDPAEPAYATLLSGLVKAVMRDGTSVYVAAARPVTTTNGRQLIRIKLVNASHVPSSEGSLNFEIRNATGAVVPSSGLFGRWTVPARTSFMAEFGVPKEMLKPGLYTVSAPGAASAQFVVQGVEHVALSKRNYQHYPYMISSPLSFALKEYGPRLFEVMDGVGANCITLTIPMLAEQRADGEIIDLDAVERQLAAADAAGKGVVFDGWTMKSFPYFDPPIGSAGTVDFGFSIYSERSISMFTAALKRMAGRAKEHQSLMGYFPLLITGCEVQFDFSEVGKNAFRTHVRDGLKLSLAAASRRYGEKLKTWDDLVPPRPDPQAQWNTTPKWKDYIDFSTQAAIALRTRCIDAIRSVDPDAQIFLRANYLEGGVVFQVASRYRGVYAHMECCETTSDTEGYFAGAGRAWNVPISCENGWCKCQGPAFKMAMGDILLGGYTDYHFSWAGPFFMLPSTADHLRMIWGAAIIRGGVYPEPRFGILLPDTSVFASKELNFFGTRSLPQIEYQVERLGIPYQSVSSYLLPMDRRLKVLMDDGQNMVLPLANMDRILQWVREEGGVFIFYPHTGMLSSAGELNAPGRSAFLRRALPGQEIAVSDEGTCTIVSGGESATFAAHRNAVLPGAKIVLEDAAHRPAVQELAYGRGKLVMLSFVPSDWGKQWDAVTTPLNSTAGLALMDTLLTGYGLTRPVAVSPAVSTAYYEKDGALYVVLYAKDPRVVGAMFSESVYKGIGKLQKDLTLTLAPAFPFARAVDAITGETFATGAGPFKVKLPGGEWRIIRLDKR
ncbi:MAG: hypothetical protein WC708_09455 [Lentisphaeria bacterium]